MLNTKNKQKEKIVVLVCKKPKNQKLEIINTLPFNRDAEDYMWQTLLRHCLDTVRHYSDDFRTAKKLEKLKIDYESKTVTIIHEHEEYFYQVLIKDVEM